MLARPVQLTPRSIAGGSSPISCSPYIPVPCRLWQRAAASARSTVSRAPHSQHRRHGVVARVAQRSLAAVLAEIEELKASADALESELADASRAAEVAAKRSRRLAARSHELQEYALQHVALGDEEGARTALQQKAAVADALRQATRRAEANSALARKLEEVLVLQQSRVLAMLREANRQQQAAAASTAAASAAAAVVAAGKGAAGDGVASGRGLKRSRSVAWSSATLHASSDGCAEAADVAAAAAEAVAAAAAAAKPGSDRGQQEARKAQ